MKEYKFPTQSLIGGWFINKNICDNLINYFNSHKSLQKIGKISDTKLISKVDKNFKECRQISIDKDNYENPFLEYRVELQNTLENFFKKYYYSSKMLSFGLNENYNLQFYKKNQGFKKWHFEDGHNLDKDRRLVFMTYLNDVDDGGTEFKYQNIISPAKKGLTIIWPAGWTHTHKGQISKTKEKYIVTGWYSLNNFN